MTSFLNQLWNPKRVLEARIQGLEAEVADLRERLRVTCNERNQWQNRWQSTLVERVIEQNNQEAADLVAKLHEREPEAYQLLHKLGIPTTETSVWHRVLDVAKILLAGRTP